MSKSSLSQIPLKADYRFNKVPCALQFPPQRHYFKQIRPDQFPERKIISKKTYAKAFKSARITPNDSIIEATAEVLKPTCLKVRGSETIFLSPRSPSVPRSHFSKFTINNTEKRVLEKGDNQQDSSRNMLNIKLKANHTEGEKHEFQKHSTSAFSGTYSIKYFGALDNQFGVVSQRVPIPNFHTDNSPSRALEDNIFQTDKRFSRLNLGNYQDQTLVQKTMNDASSSPRGRGIQILDNRLQNKSLVQRRTLTESQTDVPKSFNNSREMNKAIFNQISNTTSVNDKLVNYQSKRDLGSKTERELRDSLLDTNFKRGFWKKGFSAEKLIKSKAVASYSLTNRLQGLLKQKQKAKEEYITAYKQIKSNIKTSKSPVAPLEIPLLKIKKNIPSHNQPKIKKKDSDAQERSLILNHIPKEILN